jgi:dihydrolipoamide dehydrogenase
MQLDLVVIGAGPAGEAATHLARARGLEVAVVDRDLFGGSCPFWGCIPSKSLLHAAAQHAVGADYPWQRASERRDWMTERVERDYPDDSGHVKALESAGASVIRGQGRLVGPGRVAVRHDGAEHELEASNIILAVGSESKVPPIEGIGDIRTWTNRDATATRELPESLLVLGGGPTGVELAQVYARFGVPVTIIHSHDRLLSGDHPRNSEAAGQALARDGVQLRLGVRAARAVPRSSDATPDIVELDDGSRVSGHATLLALGRASPTASLGLESIGIDAATLPRDGRLRIADGLYLVGDVAGPELHTHQAHYQGEMAVRMIVGEDVRPDYRALPRAIYIDPELASVGLTLEQARDQGIDAFEVVADVARSAKGQSVEAEFGHVTLVVDRGSRELVGAAMAAPDASAAIHECVLAIRARVPIEVLADTIHAYPSTSRILNGLFAEAARRLVGEA